MITAKEKIENQKKNEVLKESNEKLEGFKEKSEHMNRKTDRGIVNEESGASIGIRNNGDISIASNIGLQYKLQSETGTASEISIQSNTITNRKDLTVDEIIVNKHKLNPQLYELADFRQLFGDKKQAIGNLTMMGTVLVRAWEPSLEKHVLIRRQVRIPVFSPLLNIADSPKEIGIDTDVADTFTKMKRGEFDV